MRSRIVGNGVIIDEGLVRTRRTDQYAFGIRLGHGWCTQFPSNNDGADIPGVDTASSSMPNPAYASNAYMNGAGDFDAVDRGRPMRALISKVLNSPFHMN